MIVTPRLAHSLIRCWELVNRFEKPADIRVTIYNDVPVLTVLQFDVARGVDMIIRRVRVVELVDHFMDSPALMRLWWEREGIIRRTVWRDA